MNRRDFALSAVALTALPAIPALGHSGEYTLAMQNLSTDYGDWQYLPPETNTPLIWDHTEENGLGAFDPTNPTRLTVPDGVKKVRLTAGCAIKFWNDAPFFQMWCRKNASGSYNGYLSQTLPEGSYYGSSPAINVAGPIINVNPGDYFELMAWQAGGGTGVLIKSRRSTYFQMELIS